MNWPTQPFLRQTRRWLVPRAKRRRPSGPVTAIDLDGPILRVAQTTLRGGAPAVTRVHAVPLELSIGGEAPDPAVLGRAIAKALDRFQLRSSSIVMGVPRAQVVLRTLTLPAIDDLGDLASAVYFQVSKDLPFRPDDAVIDFKVRRRIAPAVSPPLSPAPADNAPVAPAKLEVLVAATKREVVEFYQQTAAAAGLKLAALGLLPYANARCVEACHVADGAQAFALVSLRPDEVNIDVIGEQSLLFSRGANLKVPAETAASPEPAVADRKDPASSPAETDAPSAATTAPPSKAEAFIAAAVLEVVRTLHSFSGIDPLNPVAKVVVTGATGHESAVVELLGPRLASPCTLLDPRAALGLPDSSWEEALGGLAAIGLALGFTDAKGLPFNFLSPKRPVIRRDLRQVRWLAAAAALIVALMIFGTIRTRLIHQRTKLMEVVAAELAEAEKKRPIYRRLTLQAGTVDDWIRGGRSWLEHYAYLSSVLPPSEQVYLTSLSVSMAGNLQLAVQAQSGEVLFNLEKQLRAAGYEVKPLAIKPGADRFGYEFRSSIELAVPSKLKIDLAKTRPPVRPGDDASLDPNVRKRGAR